MKKPIRTSLVCFTCLLIVFRHENETYGHEIALILMCVYIVLWYIFYTAPAE